MPVFTRDKLQEWTHGEWFADSNDTRVQGFSIDSRRIDREHMFIALKTPQRDGHEFLVDARRRGAAAALTEQWIPHADIPQLRVKQGANALQDIARNYRKQFGLPVVGITGSCGKTSTKDALALLLGGKDKVLKTSGNLNNTLGVPLTLLSLDEAKHNFGVVEAGINMKGEMRQLADMIDAEIGIVTMIGHAHLELLGGLQQVAEEKVQLLLGGRQKQALVFPHSCMKYDVFRKLNHAKNLVLTPLGAETESNHWSEYIHYWCELRDNGWVLSLLSKDGPVRTFSVPKISAGMRQNLALSIVTASELGVSDELIQKRIFEWQPSDNRGEILKADDQWIYSDCYNANPDSMVDSLNAFENTFSVSLPRYYVLGSMYELGPQSTAYHRQLGAKLKLRTKDKVACVGDFANDLRLGLLQAGVNAAQITCADNADALKTNINEFKGAVFLKGSRANRLERLIPENCSRTILDTGKLC